MKVITKMYEELIKALRNCTNPDKCCEDCDFFDKCYKSKKHFSIEEQAADAIEDLEKCLAIALLEYQKANNKLLMTEEYVKQKSRWIPVTERLPKYMENVLVTDGMFSGMGWFDYYDCHGTKPRENYWIAPSTNVNELGITHWMPLPEPPKEDG